MSDLFSWLLSIGSFAGIVLLTALAARSFAGDASHGRRRCPRCWHELGPSGLRCAECGHLARDENDVSRTRRSPWRGVFALLGVVAIALAARTRFLDRGPWSVAPTSVLLSATPWFADGGYRSAPWELAQRISAGSLDEAQLARAVRVFAEGDSDAPPSSDTWKAKYGQIGRALLLRVPRNDASLLPLIDVPPRISLDVLPGDSTAPLLALDAEVWWPSFVEGRATVKFADGTQREARFEPGGRAPGLLLATTPELLGTTCSVTLSHRIRGSDEAWTDSSPVEIAIPAPRSARPPTGTLLAETDAQLRDAIAAAFAEGLVVWKSGTPRAGLRFNTAATADERFTDVAIGLVVELLEDGVPRRTSRIWWRGGIAGASPRWLPSEEDAEALGRLWAAPTDQDSAIDTRWSLRIRGDAQLANYAQYLATDDERNAPAIVLARRFEGSIEIPVVIERMNAPSPARRWMEQRTPKSE
ncbi:MAG: hypothetical protein RL591_990 [Planctomycetota bacterium]